MEISLAFMVLALHLLVKFVFKGYLHKASDLLHFSHPPVGIRQRMIYHTLRRLCDDRLVIDISSEKLNNIYLDTIDKVENTFNEISESPMTRSAIDFAYTSEASDHAFAILKNWKNIKPQLEK